MTFITAQWIDGTDGTDGTVGTNSVRIDRVVLVGLDIMDFEYFVSKVFWCRKARPNSSKTMVEVS